LSIVLSFADALSSLSGRLLVLNRFFAYQSPKKKKTKHPNARTTGTHIMLLRSRKRNGFSNGASASRGIGDDVGVTAVTVFFFFD
jgi:hypothetical protein